MRTTSSQTTRSAWPLLAICCLGLVALLIAATIVLALIPVYLPRRTATLPNVRQNDEFFIQYSADADIDSSTTGTVDNLDEVGRALNLGDDVELLSGQAQATFVRRKRALLNRRQKRTLKTNFLFRCRPRYKQSCRSQSCRDGVRSRAENRIKSRTNIPNLSCRIRTGGILKTFTFSLAFVGVIVTKPIGFAGEAASLTFVAVRSGAFNDPLTWADGIVPYGDCSVVIPAGLSVTLARPVLEIRMKKCDVYGSLALGSGSSTFQFNFPPNIIVRSGGIIDDLTSSRRVLLPAKSLLTLLPGGGFSSAGTVIQTYSPSGLGSTVRLNSASGPFTCGILPGGNLLSYNKVTYIVQQSGGFTSGSTFLGDIAPSAEICSLGGCGISVPAGYTLSTADLNGAMNLQIDVINVAVGGVLQLGTPGSNGFRFVSPIQLIVGGQLSFVGSGGGILIPPNSAVNLLPGSIFTSVVPTFIQVYNPLTGVSIGLPLTLPVSLNGPYYVTITVAGIITISITQPGGNDFSTTIATTATSTPALG